MTYDNTLICRCTVAIEKIINDSDHPAHTTRTRRAGVAAVLEHLTAELVALNLREPRISVHEVARMLTLEAAGELAGWDKDEEVAG